MQRPKANTLNFGSRDVLGQNTTLTPRSINGCRRIVGGGGGGGKGGQYPYSLHASRCGCLVRRGGVCDGGGNTPDVSWAAWLECRFSLLPFVFLPQNLRNVDNETPLIIKKCTLRPFKISIIKCLIRSLR